MYSYLKENKRDHSENDVIEISEVTNNTKNKRRITLWTLMGDTYSGLKDVSQSNSIAKLLIPGVFILIGSLFIYQEFYPEVQQMVQQNAGYYNQSIFSPVDEEYVNISKYIARPEGIPNLTKSAFGLNILAPDPVSANFSGIFYISIPSIGINRLPVKANVDSTSESSYLSVLDSALAHFMSTGLPISDVGNNVVIYGHSASMNYGPQRTDPTLAFSFIPELKIGDEIFIDINGQSFKYKMFQSKIVEPEDTSIITGTKGRRTLTLFTCFPLGSNAQRYIAIARPA